MQFSQFQSADQRDHKVLSRSGKNLTFSSLMGAAFQNVRDQSQGCGTINSNIV